MTLYSAILVLEKFTQTLGASSEERAACEVLIDTINALNEHAPSRVVIESMELYRARRAMRQRESIVGSS